MDLKKHLEAYDKRLQWCLQIRELLTVLAGYDAPDPTRIGLGDLTWNEKLGGSERDVRKSGRVTLKLLEPGHYYFRIEDLTRQGNNRYVFDEHAATPEALVSVIPKFLEKLKELGIV